MIQLLFSRFVLLRFMKYGNKINSGLIHSEISSLILNPQWAIRKG